MAKDRPLYIDLPYGIIFFWQLVTPLSMHQSTVEQNS